jgi:hypothetical protein
LLFIADFGDHAFGEKAFISGVNVCLNRSGDKVNGWTLTGRKIEPDGRLIDLTSSTNAARPNCDEYQEAINCPAGEVATAAMVHYGPGAERQSWIGMALQCRAVRVKS